MKITNPLISEPGMSDPHALVTDEAVYLFTGHDVGHGINDWVMPRWRIFRSVDLKTWTRAGRIDPKDNFMGAGNTHCWAGDIVHRNGKYYWFFSNYNIDSGVMVADKPEGPYKDVLGKPLLDSFDPSIFTDDDGTPYIVVGHGDYKIARLKESLIELDEEPRPISLNRKDTFPVMDKNSLHKHGGLYYLGCSGYYAVSENVYGPYEYRGMTGTGWALETPYAHGDYFIWKDQWYHVWCRYRDRTVDCVRDCFIAPVSYGADGSMTDDLSGLPVEYKSSVTMPSAAS